MLPHFKRPSSPPSLISPVRYYLHADYAVRCTDDAHRSEEHDAIKAVAYVLMALWPVGVPLLFGALLHKSRAAPDQRRLAGAIGFLRNDYTNELVASYWELLELCRKEVLTGFLLLVPQHLNSLRIVFGLLLSISHLTLLLSARPCLEWSRTRRKLLSAAKHKRSSGFRARGVIRASLDDGGQRIDCSLAPWTARST